MNYGELREDEWDRSAVLNISWNNSTATNAPVGQSYSGLTARFWYHYKESDAPNLYDMLTALDNEFDWLEFTWTTTDYLRNVKLDIDYIDLNEDPQTWTAQGRYGTGGTPYDEWGIDSKWEQYIDPLPSNPPVKEYYWDEDPHGWTDLDDDSDYALDQWDVESFPPAPWTNGEYDLFTGFRNVYMYVESSNDDVAFARNSSPNSYFSITGYNTHPV